MKQLNCLKYHTSGGLCNEKDLHGNSLEFTITEDNVYCNLSLIIGGIIITKVFKNKEHRILNDMVSLLNTCDFEKLNTDYNRMTLMDLPDNIIEYSYDDYEELTEIKNPNSKDLIQLLNDFMKNYLLKDSELLAIFNSIINNNKDVDYLSLRHIIKNDNVFDIEKKYNLNELTEDIINAPIQQKQYNSMKNVSIDDLISKIDKEIENIDK